MGGIIGKYLPNNMTEYSGIPSAMKRKLTNSSGVPGDVYEHNTAKRIKLSGSRNVPGDAYTEVLHGKDLEIQQLKTKIKRLEQSCMPKEEYERMRQKYQAEKDAKDEALRRLSAMASSRLRDNNPNITDLSDQNRPTKIAEKMSELYDNQWTDAFDALARNMTETEIIRLLLDLFMKSYQECRAIATDRYFENIQRCIELPLQGKVSSPLRSTNVLPDSLKQQIKEFRKCRAGHVIKDVEKAIKEKLQTPYNHYDAVRKYISSCVEITWLMVVQDPPLVLSVSSSSKFDSNIFKDYTKRGTYVEYVVWPALFLHDKGALLAKGVAQGCSQPHRRH